MSASHKAAAIEHGSKKLYRVVDGRVTVYRLLDTIEVFQGEESQRYRVTPEEKSWVFDSPYGSGTATVR